MAQAGGGGGGGWGAPNGGGGGWGTPNPNAPNIYRIYNVDQVPLPFVVRVTYADGSTDGYSGRGWGEHCDDEPIEPLGGGWVPRSLDDPLVMDWRCASPDHALRGYCCSRRVGCALIGPSQLDTKYMYNYDRRRHLLAGGTYVQILVCYSIDYSIIYAGTYYR